MTDIDQQARIITDIQQACRRAKDSKSNADLEFARLLMVGADYQALPAKAKEDLRMAYAAAVMTVTGALVG